MAKKFWTTLAIACGLFIMTFHISAAKVAEEATYTAAEKAAIVQVITLYPNSCAQSLLELWSPRCPS